MRATAFRKFLSRVARRVALNSPRMEKVLAYLKNNEPKFIEQLCDYVRFPSVSAQKEKHGPDMKACGEWLLAQYRALGLEAQLHPTAGNPILVAKLPRRKG